MSVSVSSSTSSVPAVNITIQKGTDFENTFTIKNADGSSFDLTGYTGSAKIRKFAESTTSSSFTVGFVTSSGQVVISMARTMTGQLSNGRNYYDVLLTSSSNKVTKRIEGMVLVSPSVSI